MPFRFPTKSPPPPGLTIWHSFATTLTLLSKGLMSLASVIGFSRMDRLEFPRSVPFIETKNHMCSQHNVKTPYIEVCFCALSNIHTFFMIKIQVKIRKHH